MVLLRERLERTKLIAPVCELELTADEITAGAGANLELFPSTQLESTSLNRFIEKLSSRLGPQAITGLKVIPDHRPERSQRFELLETSGMNRMRETRRKAISAKLVRPVWLTEPPLELKLQRHQPVYGSPLKLIEGPERIEAGWWDDALIARDYFIAENELGQLLWIYREHDPAEDKKDKAGGWYLQGLFG